MIKKIFLGLFSKFIATDVVASEKWKVGTFEDNGKPIIIRSLSKVPDGISTSDYPNMMAVSWKFESINGMPSPAEKELMNEFEESVTELVESEEKAYLTLIVTGNEVCEWQFYTKNKVEFMTLLNQALSGKKSLPIQLSVETDPDWSAFKQYQASDDST